MRGVDGERVLAGRPSELPRGEEPVAASALASRRVRNATALEQDADAAASVVAAERRLGVVERPLRVLEAVLQPLGARDLRQRLCRVPAAGVLVAPGRGAP